MTRPGPRSPSLSFLLECSAVLKLLDNVESSIKALCVVQPRITEALVLSGQVIIPAGSTDALCNIYVNCKTRLGALLFGVMLTIPRQLKMHTTKERSVHRMYPEGVLHLSHHFFNVSSLDSILNRQC